MPSQMPCPVCGAANRPGRRFCAECGSVLAVACPSCDAANEPGDRFCGHCGSPLPPSAAPVEPSPSGDPGGTEVRHVSVMFCDLVGYTALSEGRDAEDVRDVLSGYFDTARTVVARYGGRIEKYVGDAVMAVWGATAALEDDAERSVRAALDLVEAVRVYGEGIDVPLQARAGVVTGRAASVVNPQEGIVVGDRVNTAARVQSVADPEHVLVDDRTREATAGGIQYADAGTHTVKGKAEPLHLWRAERVVAGVGGSRRAPEQDTPLVGRSRELTVIRELFHACAEEGRARLLVLSGPAGSGKSRLLWEFEKHLDGLAGDVLWHTGRCLAYGDGVAFWALAEMARHRFDIAQDDDPTTVAAKLTAGLERWVPDPATRAFVEPRAGVLLGVEDARLPREELFAGWRLLFQQLAVVSPVVLAFEDMQWADPGLVQFIEQLLDWSGRSPLFIVVLARPELAERHPELVIGRANVTSLGLDPLSDAAVGALLDRLVPLLPRATRAALVERAAGVPLYAVEIARSLGDRAAGNPTAGEGELPGDLDDLRLPATLTGLLAARIDALRPSERILVRELCVFGGSFPPAAAVAVSDLPTEEVDRALAGLVRKAVLTVQGDPLSPDRGHLAFGQALLRTAAYGTLSKRERRDRHLRVAEHLRTAFPDDGEEVVEVIAAHYRDAWEAVPDAPDGDALRRLAADSYGRAGHRAAAVGAPLTAMQAYRTAARLADREEAAVHWLTSAAEMAEVAGRIDEALELYERLASDHAAAGRPEAARQLAAPIGWLLGRLGRFGEAEQRVRAGLAVVADDDPAAAPLVLALAWILLNRGDVAGSVAQSERGLVLAAAGGDPALLARAAGARADAVWSQGRTAEALVLYRWATEDLGSALAPSDRLRMLVNAADTSACTDAPTARVELQRALDESRRLGDVLTTGAAANLALFDLFAGHPDEAERLVAECLDTVPADPRTRLAAHGVLVQRFAQLGDVVTARQHLAEVSAWVESEDAQGRTYVDVLAGLVADAAEDDEEALARCGSGVRAAKAELGLVSESFRSGWPVAVQSALALGRLEEAADLVDLVATHPPGFVPPFVRAELSRFQGRLAAERGDAAAAAAALRAAVDQLAPLGYPYWLACAQADLAAELQRTGRSEEARPLREEAIRTLTRLGARAVLRRLGAPPPPGRAR